MESLRAVRPDRLDHRPGPSRHRRRDAAPALRRRQLLHQRQADRRRRRPAAVRRRPRVRHQRQGRRRAEPAALDQRPLDQGDVRPADRPRLPAHGLSRSERVCRWARLRQEAGPALRWRAAGGQPRSDSQAVPGALLAADRVDDGGCRGLLDLAAEERDRGLEVAVDGDLRCRARRRASRTRRPRIATGAPATSTVSVPERGPSPARGAPARRSRSPTASGRRWTSRSRAGRRRAGRAWSRRARRRRRGSPRPRAAARRPRRTCAPGRPGR